MNKERAFEILNIRTQIESLSRSLRSLEDEQAAEAIAASTVESEETIQDFELSPYLHVAIDQYGNKSLAESQGGAQYLLGRKGGYQIEPVVKLSDANKVIRELSDMVTSLSETQGVPLTGDAFEDLNTLHDALENLGSLVTDHELELMFNPEDQRLNEVNGRVVELLNQQGVIGLPLSCHAAVLPAQLDKCTKDLILGFAFSLAMKLRQAEIKYGYEDAWMTDDWMDKCKVDLRKHLEKGDPKDVAAYAMFLWYHKQTTRLIDQE